MKKITAIATYSAWVEDDITVSMVKDLVEEEIRNNCDGFRICIDDYTGENDNCPYFDIDNVKCGTEIMIAAGKQLSIDDVMSLFPSNEDVEETFTTRDDWSSEDKLVAWAKRRGAEWMLSAIKIRLKIKP